MTKKDYVAIAKILSDAQFINLTTQGEVAVNTDTRRRIAFSLANVMQADNARFDRARFLSASDIKE